MTNSGLIPSPQLATVSDAPVLKISTDDGVPFPEYKTKTAACFDITATGVKSSYENQVIYHTGLYFDPPDGYSIEVNIRSGLAFKEGFMLANGTGIIDNDYRGELLVSIVKMPGTPFAEWPQAGDRIAQAKLVKDIRAELKAIPKCKLSETDRGEGGFGSTGRK